MSRHEHKICPRCNNSFKCRAGDICKCQCDAVKLDNTERDYIARNYTDCLCAPCMHALKTAYHQAQQEITIKRLFGIR